MLCALLFPSPWLGLALSCQHNHFWPALLVRDKAIFSPSLFSFFSSVRVPFEFFGHWTIIVSWLSSDKNGNSWRITPNCSRGLAGELELSIQSMVSRCQVGRPRSLVSQNLGSMYTKLPALRNGNIPPVQRMLPSPRRLPNPQRLRNRAIMAPLNRNMPSRGSPRHQPLLRQQPLWIPV